MTRLRAATLSNKLVKVRQKRKGDEVFDLTNEPVKAKRKTKKPDLNRTDSIASNNSHGSGVVPCDVPWPDHFKRLGTLHRSLNTIYVFCCTRKHVITTFDTLKSSVEAQIKRPLQVSDVAQLKYLLPSVINFSYVSEAALQVNILEQGGGSKPDVYDPSFSKESVNRHALYLEYVDGELKHKITKTQFGFRRAINDELKVLEYTPAAMAKLIAKRNKKFDNAVNAFLSACRENAVDPEMKITDESQSFIPETPKVEEDTLQTTAGQIPTEIPKVRASIEEIVDDLQKDEHYSCQIVPNGRRILPAQPARYGELSKQLSQDMVNALYNSKNISQFFTHQADAINNLWEGHNVIVATSTSSGKSLIYQLPVLCALEEDAASRAMYIFPTKALAQDQKRSLIDLMSYMPGLQDVIVDTYDGDTPMDERTRIRDQASIIFTNPDMLHVNLLPKEEYWRTFLKHLKFVVVDELHVYNGLFGAHVAFVMRRLRRLCHTLGNRHVQFISCSATIANPVEHMCTVFGLKDVKLIEEDGSPAGKKEFLCWNCPYKDVDDSSSGKVDACTESARLLVNLILRGVRTIAFCKVRRMCEAVLQAVHRQLQYVDRPDVKSRVMSYRGGYTPQDRRRIEKEMFEGQLLGIIATNALELGVDIGSLDAVVIVGFPYSIANLRQQSGRAGRRNKDSLAILVGEAYPIDQHFMNKPDELFTKPNNSLQLDLSNPLVLEGHLQCAAFEMPIRVEEDKHFFGAELASLAHDRLQADLQGFFHCHPRFRPYPSKFVAMRDVEEEHFPIVDITNGRNHVLEELEASRAFFTIYEGAIFMHQGSTYLVREFNPDKKMAKVERANVEWTTRQRDYTDVDPIETQAIRHLEGSPCRVYYGNIRVTMVVFGFFKLDKNRRILDAIQVNNPPVIINSKGMWIDIPREPLEILQKKRLNIAASIHAAEHAIVSLMPNFVMSMPGDVRTECKAPQKEFAKKETSRKRPARLTFYDAKGGSTGSGISTKAFEFIDSLLRQAITRVEQCGCREGCPECVASTTCAEANAVISKAGASVILRSILHLPIDMDAIPEGPEEGINIETVVAIGVPVHSSQELQVIRPIKEEVEEQKIKVEEVD